MTMLERIKSIFFTEADRGIVYPDELQKIAHQQHNVINDGAQSKLLMSNPIFQQAVAEIYLSLEAELDMIDDCDPLADKKVSSVRAQRRALRQVCALLDNKIAAQEHVEQYLKEEADES